MKSVTWACDRCGAVLYDGVVHLTVSREQFGHQYKPGAVEALGSRDLCDKCAKALKFYIDGLSEDLDATLGLPTIDEMANAAKDDDDLPEALKGARAQAEVWRALRDNGPMTSEALWDVMGENRHTILSTLVRRGFVLSARRNGGLYKAVFEPVDNRVGREQVREDVLACCRVPRTRMEIWQALGIAAPHIVDTMLEDGPLVRYRSGRSWKYLAPASTLGGGSRWERSPRRWPGLSTPISPGGSRSPSLRGTTA